MGWKEINMEGEDELAMLVGTLVRTAKALLKSQRGEFVPFAAFVNAAGGVEMLGADPRVGEQNAISSIDFLHGALRAMVRDGQITSSGICANVTARLPGYEGEVDAICCFIERAGQPPIDFYVPFRKGLFGRPVLLPGTSKVFTGSGDTA
jgi:hypothetical protein